MGVIIAYVTLLPVTFDSYRFLGSFFCLYNQLRNSHSKINSECASNGFKTVWTSALKTLNLSLKSLKGWKVIQLDDFSKQIRRNIQLLSNTSRYILENIRCYQNGNLSYKNIHLQLKKSLKLQLKWLLCYKFMATMIYMYLCNVTL